MSSRRTVVQVADGSWEEPHDAALTLCVRCRRPAARCGCSAAQREAAIKGVVEEPEIEIGEEELQQ